MIRSESLVEDTHFDYFLKSIVWEMHIRNKYRTRPQDTPYQLVFGRYMIHNIIVNSIDEIRL
jgi:hypothetical protein